MIREYKEEEIVHLRELLSGGIRTADSLQAAAQTWTRLVYEHFDVALALVRCYVTVPARALPQAYKSFAENLSGVKLADATPVLCLLGSSGEDPNWNDPARSKGHLAIPLLSAAAVSSIPMVTRLLQDLGLGLNWLESHDTDFIVRTLGRTAGVFYVDDARTRTDDRNRKVVPAQDFVEEHGVRTVFGIGGAYVTGSIICCILFTKENLERERVERFLPLINGFKIETMSHAIGRRVFASGQGA